MKTFKEICQMSQEKVKAYMHEYLKSKQYDVINEDGFLYAKGDVPVLVMAHMDTVHKLPCTMITEVGGKISSPQGIGGDDRCGIFIIMNLVKELHCSVLLCEEEERGCIGAHKFANTDYIKNLHVNYMVEFDRKGNNDAVFYHCGNQDFIDFVEDATNFKFADGSVSDISVLMEPANLSAVNLSCGYYNAHFVTEYVIYDEMMDTIDAAKVLIKEKCDKPFMYVKKERTIPKSWQNFNNSHKSYVPGYAQPHITDDEYYQCLFYEESEYKDDCLANTAMSDTDLELEVIIYGMDLSEKTLIASGDTKAECWMTLFLENPNLCFNDIVDYSWN
jgi:hypothetical protein